MLEETKNARRAGVNFNNGPHGGSWIHLMAYDTWTTPPDSCFISLDTTWRADEEIIRTVDELVHKSQTNHDIIFNVLKTIGPLIWENI